LRGFELILLKDIGLLPALNAQTLTLKAVVTDEHYALVPEAGLQWVPADDRSALTGGQWLALQAALDDANPMTALVRDCADLLVQLQRPMRLMLNYHCGVGALRTRQMMLDLQTL
jgi:DNA repair protein RecO (recombination protein O)